MMPLPIAVAQAAVAQKACESLQADSTTARLAAAQLPGFSATITANQPTCMGWDVITIYGPLDTSAPDKAPARYWVARHDQESREGSVTTTWADSRSCPTFVAALNALSTLSVTIRLDGLRGGDGVSFPIPVMDGTWFTIDAYLARQPDDRFASISMSSNEGAIASWGRDFLERMMPCWQKARPPMPG